MERDADVLVIGAGLAGLTAAFDLAGIGRRVLMVDQSGAHGGFLTLLDRQFSTDSCGFCQILPQQPGVAQACLKSLLEHPCVEFLSSTVLESVQGKAGAFRVGLIKKARCIDPARCTHCGRCMEVCPEAYPDPLQGGVVTRKAVGYRSPLCIRSELAIDADHCTRCGLCASACPENAVDLDEVETRETRRVGAIIQATGFHMIDPSVRPEYGYGRYPDVVTTFEFERRYSRSLLGGAERIGRPSDGAVPTRIAWIQCVGSREERRNYCSSVCCMISLKEARLCRSLLPDAHLEIFYMDMRTCGKGYERYLNRAAGMGVRFTRGRPAEVLQRDGRLWVQVESEDGAWREDPFDLVVLSVGFEPAEESKKLAGLLGIGLDRDGFLIPVPGYLSRTGRDGVYVAGAAGEPRDIPEVVMQAHEAAHLAGLHAVPEEVGRDEPGEPPVTDLGEEDLRVLVSLCDCSGTLNSSIDWALLLERLEKEPDVVGVTRGSRLCMPEDATTLLRNMEDQRANALVLGGCTPRWLENRLRDVLAPLGLDPNLIQVVNLREQIAWAHGSTQTGATERAESELGAALEAFRAYRPLLGIRAFSPDEAVLVVGGGPAGISAAVALGELGHPVFLVERLGELGGNLRRMRYGLDPDFQPGRILEDLLEKVRGHSGIEVFTSASVAALEGHPGSFQARLHKGDGSEALLRFGAMVLATGAEMHIPAAFRYGQDDRILTQRDLEDKLAAGSLDVRSLTELAMIQCVGSRDDEHPYCSRICCAAALKNVLKLLEINSDLRVFVFYRDLRAFGTLERYYGKARQMGAVFVPFDPTEPPSLELEDGELVLEAWEPVLGMRMRYRPQRVVLSAGLEPRRPDELMNDVGLRPGPDGFLPEVNPKFRPLDLHGGIYGCGSALGPAFLAEALAQGRGAAQRAAAFLRGLAAVPAGRGARVNERRCAACGLCVQACPYGARELDEETGHARVLAALCQACGVCAAVCPNGATQLVGWTDRQMLSAIDALVG